MEQLESVSGQYKADNGIDYLVSLFSKNKTAILVVGGLLLSGTVGLMSEQIKVFMASYLAEGESRENNLPYDLTLQRGPNLNDFLN